MKCFVIKFKYVKLILNTYYAFFKLKKPHTEQKFLVLCNKKIILGRTLFFTSDLVYLHLNEKKKQNGNKK